MATDTPATGGPGLRPYFNMELFLAAAGETRLSGRDMDECVTLWEMWMQYIHAREIGADGAAYLALWLDPAVEGAVDAAWERSPSRGFRLHALAQTLCMAAVHDCIPEVEDAGCAPVPVGSQALAASLTKAGLPASSGERLILGRKYAVVSAMPFKGGCETCALQQGCPRLHGRDAGIVLPGHERP